MQESEAVNQRLPPSQIAFETRSSPASSVIGEPICGAAGGGRNKLIGTGVTGIDGSAGDVTV